MAMTKRRSTTENIMLQGLVCLLAFANCEPLRHPASSGSGYQQGRSGGGSVLRGLKSQKEEVVADPKGNNNNNRAQKLQKKAVDPASIRAPKNSPLDGGGPPPPPPPAIRATKNGNNNKRLYDEYNYFVEACQEELVADVINGNVIQHNQFTDFVYGYCRGSGKEGPKCTKEQQDLGFDYLPNGVKLMYIKSFCPQDVEGQVQCLHGINEEGREYEFNDEIDKLCKDLETLMYKNFLLEDKEDKKDPAKEDVSDGSPIVEDDQQQVDGGILEASQHDQAYPAAIDDYRTNFDPPEDGYDVVTAQTDYDYYNTPSPSFSLPTRRPTPQAAAATGSGNNNNKHPDTTTQDDDDSDGLVASNIIHQPDTTSQSSGNEGHSSKPTDATSSTTTTTADNPDESFATIPVSNSPPTTRPARTSPPGLTVVDGNGNPIHSPASSSSSKVNVSDANNNEGPSGGGAIAIVLIILLGITIAATVVLLIRKHRLMQNSHMNMRQEFFFMCMKRGKQCDETYDKDDTLIENNGSIASEEIEFNGPLFESWPTTDDMDDDCLRYKRRGGDDASFGTRNYGGDTAQESDGDDRSQAQESDSDPSTYKSSLLHSFFSKTAELRSVNDEDLTPSENAIDEIKRAINDAQWRDVYYLASKMASEGNIDSKDNLKSALVRTPTKESGPDFARPVSRTHLKPEDAGKAAQLDLSLAVGDWITLAARAAVFAALDSANNPVPSSICFVPGEENADDCLTKAKAALEEVEKAAKAQKERQQQSSSPEPEDDEEESTQERVVFVNADEETDDDDFEYPEDDYSDFTRSASRSGNGETESDEAISETPPNDESSPLISSGQDSNESDEEDTSDESDNEDTCTSSTISNIPGAPSIAMSNQSSIPTQPSNSEDIPFASLASVADASRGPFIRDFGNGISHPMEQVEQTEIKPVDKTKMNVALLAPATEDTLRLV